MTMVARYKRLVLELCRDGSMTERLLTPDFVDAGAPLTGADVEIIGLVAEGNTVILRVRMSGQEQVQLFEGRDARLASRRCFDHRPITRAVVRS